MNRPSMKPPGSKGLFRTVLYVLLTLAHCTTAGLSSENQAAVPTDQQLLGGQPYIYKLQPERPEGRGYKLIYMVDAPLDVYWKFKTDFDNDFLLSNRLIIAHRFVRRTGNAVVTENKYSSKPNATFKWRTSIYADRQLLKFTLLNPAECGQKYHYGYIQMKAFGQSTRVTQVAYFDFFGVSFWVDYPLYGGMKHFLEYTAAWEQQTVLELKHKYAE